VIQFVAQWIVYLSFRPKGVVKPDWF
jgi:hypothetical protein